jgi:hypothetical protein
MIGKAEKEAILLHEPSPILRMFCQSFLQSDLRDWQRYFTIRSMESFRGQQLSMNERLA